MDMLGFIFGISGMTFDLMGMTMAINATAKVNELEERLSDKS